MEKILQKFKKMMIFYADLPMGIVKRCKDVVKI